MEVPWPIDFVTALESQRFAIKCQINSQWFKHYPEVSSFLESLIKKNANFKQYHFQESKELFTTLA